MKRKGETAEAPWAEPAVQRRAWAGTGGHSKADSHTIARLKSLPFKILGFWPTCHVCSREPAKQSWVTWEKIKDWEERSVNYQCFGV